MRRKGDPTQWFLSWKKMRLLMLLAALDETTDEEHDPCLAVASMFVFGFKRGVYGVYGFSTLNEGTFGALSSLERVAPREAQTVPVGDVGAVLWVWFMKNKLDLYDLKRLSADGELKGEQGRAVSWCRAHVAGQ